MDTQTSLYNYAAQSINMQVKLFSLQPSFDIVTMQLLFTRSCK